MRILVTGAAGFGGSGLVKALIDHGHEVVGVDIVAPKHANLLFNVLAKIEYRWKSCQDLGSDDLYGVQIVVHMAAQADVPMGFQSPRWTIENNITATLRLLEAARHCSLNKLILASSGSVFGRALRIPITEDHALTPHNPYAASKACQELLCQAYHRSYKVPVVIMRNGIVYGPNMRREIFIWKWLEALLSGGRLVIEGGAQTRDPCYVSDTIDAWMRCIEAPQEKVVGEVFQVSFGREWSVLDIARLCAKTVGIQGDDKFEISSYRAGEEGQRECFNIEKAKNVLGYSPTVSLEDGLLKLVTWMRQNGFPSSREAS